MKFFKEILLFIFVILVLNIYTVYGQCTYITATSSSQYIESHSSYGSSHYTTNLDKCWIITTQDSSQIVELYRSSTFELEASSSSSCSWDRLRAYDSSTNSGSTYVNFCGSNIFTYLWSSGSSMYLRFETDHSNNYDGFRIRVKQVSSSWYSSSRWSSSYYSYSSSSSSSSSTTSLSLSIGTIIGIVMGVIFGIVVLVIICVVICVGAAAGTSRGRRVGVVRGANTTVITQQQQMAQPVGAQPYPAPHPQPYATGPAPPPYSSGPAPPPPAPASQYPPTSSQYPPPPASYTAPPAYPPPSANPVGSTGPPSNYPST